MRGECIDESLYGSAAISRCILSYILWCDEDLNGNAVKICDTDEDNENASSNMTLTLPTALWTVWPVRAMRSNKVASTVSSEITLSISYSHYMICTSHTAATTAARNGLFTLNLSSLVSIHNQFKCTHKLHQFNWWTMEHIVPPHGTNYQYITIILVVRLSISPSN